MAAACYKYLPLWPQPAIKTRHCGQRLLQVLATVATAGYKCSSLWSQPVTSTHHCGHSLLPVLSSMVTACYNTCTHHCRHCLEGNGHWPVILNVDLHVCSKLTICKCTFTHSKTEFMSDLKDFNIPVSHSHWTFLSMTIE